MRPTEEEIEKAKEIIERSDRIDKAKQVLEEAGYYVDQLWSVDDVRNKIDGDITDIECQEILASCVFSDYIVGEINNSLSDTLQEEWKYDLK